MIAKDDRVNVLRGGVTCAAFMVSSGMRRVPGLDSCVVGAKGGALQWMSLYEDVVDVRARGQTSAILWPLSAFHRKADVPTIATAS